jgi:protein gp37
VISAIRQRLWPPSRMETTSEQHQREALNANREVRGLRLHLDRALLDEQPDGRGPDKTRGRRAVSESKRRVADWLLVGSGVVAPGSSSMLRLRRERKGEEVSDHSTIAWTEATWNPVTGCSHVSEGCRHCYAETLSRRYGRSSKPWTAQNAAENVRLHRNRLDKPLGWRKPRLVFVNSMSDLFHELVPFEFIDEVFAVMAVTPEHTYQVLTKRPDRMLEYTQRAFASEPTVRCIQLELEGNRVLSSHSDGYSWPLPNVWLGVSCEDQKNADLRIPTLVETPAALHFLSCEPLLGPIDLRPKGGKVFEMLSQWYGPQGFDSTGSQPMRERVPGLFPKVDWVIVGGESGPGFRPMALEWAEDIQRQCERAGVSYFFKQKSGRYPGQTDGVPDHMLVRQFPTGVHA